jgi:hypothetical protein
MILYFYMQLSWRLLTIKLYTSSFVPSDWWEHTIFLCYYKTKGCATETPQLVLALVVSTNQANFLPIVCNDRNCNWYSCLCALLYVAVQDISKKKVYSEHAWRLLMQAVNTIKLFRPFISPYLGLNLHAESISKFPNFNDL